MPQRSLAILEPSDPASPLSVKASHTALLLIDYHNLIISMGGSPALLSIEKANSMREWATANRILIVHCLINLKSSVPPTVKSFERFKRITAAIEAQPNVADEHLAIALREGEHHVTRLPGVSSALKSEGLVSLLETRGIKSLLLCGISTSNCVLSTARAAADEKYIVTVIGDACMDPTEGLHDTMLTSVLPTQAHVVESDEFQKLWKY